MKRSTDERIRYLQEKCHELQMLLLKVQGRQVYGRLMDLEQSNRELLDLLQTEKKARQELLMHVERLEQENSRQQRKTDRFNDLKMELEVTRYSKKNVDCQLAAAYQEIDRLKSLQSDTYLKVI